MDEDRLAVIERKLDQVAAMVAEIHAELDRFRPLLAVLRPNGGAPDALALAGLRKAVRKAGRGGS